MTRPASGSIPTGLLVSAYLVALGPSLARGGSEAPPVRYLAGAEVRAAFAKGMPLLETADYKIHASRREAPGKAEVHVLDTDVIYVLEGGATFVTGGAVVKGVDVAPGEIRDASIRGGETHRLGQGDVVVVPRGTPHQFVEVAAPLRYYVVKVTERTDSKEEAR